ncbi:hypothetical protein V8E53_012138 [Lactarius tabidus]
MSTNAPPQDLYLYFFHFGSMCLSSSPRENSPSPTFRERQRAACGQSTSSFQGSYYGQPSPTVSTTSFHQRRSPPLPAPTVPGQIRRANSPLCLSTNRDCNLFQRSADQVIPTVGFAQSLPRFQADRPSALNGANMLGVT